VTRRRRPQTNACRLADLPRNLASRHAPGGTFDEFCPSQMTRKCSGLRLRDVNGTHMTVVCLYSPSRSGPSTHDTGNNQRPAARHSSILGVFAPTRFPGPERLHPRNTTKYFCHNNDFHYRRARGSRQPRNHLAAARRSRDDRPGHLRTRIYSGIRFTSRHPTNRKEKEKKGPIDSASGLARAPVSPAGGNVPR